MELSSILYVEDEADIRSVIKLLLAECEIKVFDFETGPEAIEFASMNKTDMVVLDLMLDHMDGEEILARLRSMEMYQNTPCVFLTAKVDPETLQRLSSLDRVSIIQKPFAVSDLANELNLLFTEMNSLPESEPNETT